MNNNFVILNNKELKSFDNNVIGFPTTNNDRFILKKEIKDGIAAYSWMTPTTSSGGTGSLSFDIDRIDIDTPLSTKNTSLNVTSQFIILNLHILCLPDINNLNKDVFISVNGVAKYHVNTLAEYQQIIIHVEDVLSNTAICCNVDDMIVLQSIIIL